MAGAVARFVQMLSALVQARRLKKGRGRTSRSPAVGVTGRSLGPSLQKGTLRQDSPGETTGDRDKVRVFVRVVNETETKPPLS